MTLNIKSYEIDLSFTNIKQIINRTLRYTNFLFVFLFPRSRVSDIPDYLLLLLTTPPPKKKKKLHKTYWSYDSSFKLAQLMLVGHLSVQCQTRWYHQRDETGSLPSRSFKTYGRYLTNSFTSTLNFYLTTFLICSGIHTFSLLFKVLALIAVALLRVSLLLLGLPGINWVLSQFFWVSCKYPGDQKNDVL